MQAGCAFPTIVSHLFSSLIGGLRSGKFHFLSHPVGPNAFFWLLMLLDDM